MSRVLLLNPPGKRNYIRDYFCSKQAKSSYTSPPATLLMLSGILAQVHEVAFLDAIVERLNPRQTLDRIQRCRPEVVISLVGAVSWDEDQEFLQQVKTQESAYIIAIGDVLLENVDARLQEAKAIDAVLLNFVTADVLTLISHHDGTPVPNAVYRSPGGRGLVSGQLQPLGGEYHVPLPRHELMPLRRYRFSFMVARPMSVMLTDYGCPFRCSFCVIPGLGFGVRPLEEILEELRHLRKLGVREIFFIDQTFGARKERTLALCQAMKTLGLKFRWSCFSRADVLGPELLSAMSAAGCHTIIFGVESGSDEILAAYNKKMNLDKIRATLAACRQVRIRTAATFMLGLPGEREEQAMATISLALELPLDYAAFNVAIPRAGTALRQAAINQGLISPADHQMDQSGRESAMATRELSARQIMDLRRLANRRFYLRPGYLLRRLLTLRSWQDFKSQVADGWDLLCQLWPGGKSA